LKTFFSKLSKNPWNRRLDNTIKEPPNTSYFLLPMV
jgi:hypothetical protein